jgi:Zn-dependent protease with chaperone function
VAGAIAIFLAIVLRPRFGKLGKYTEPLDPADFPQLNRLIGEIAAANGAPQPHKLVLTNKFNAGSGSYGLSRRRFVEIGLPLWLSLTPQEQVALLGHELGHFVNGDVRRGPLTRFAFEVLANLVVITSPNRGASRYGKRVGVANVGVGGGGMAILGDLVSRWFLAIFSLFFSLCALFVDWLSMRASHQAEYAADTLAVRVSGSAAAASMLDTLLYQDVCMTLVRRSVRSGPAPDAWRRAVVDGRRAVGGKIPALRQLSMRDAAMLGRSHPPAGLRARLVESRPQSTAAVVLTEADAAQIDRELAAHYRSLRNDLMNS